MEISHCNMVNGEGLRVVLWVSGCSHNCPGCQNAYSQNPNIGLEFDEKAENEIFSELKEDWCSGLTLSGGDPLFINNRSEIISFCKKVKEQFPTKNIWLYTGYTLDEIKSDPTMSDIINTVDVIVDGEFKKDLMDPELKWRGSSNQIITRL